MRRIRIALIILASGALAAFSEELWQMPSHYKGELYRSWVTREMFDKAPSWSPESGQEDPLPVSKAVSLSAARLKDVIGSEEFRNWRVEDVGLWQISPTGQTKWFYVIRWKSSIRNPGAQVSPADFEGFSLIVSLAGECPKPVVEEIKKGTPNKEPKATL